MDNHYELLYLVSIKHTGDDLQKVIDSVTTLIKDNNGVITYDNIIGKQRLAYPIKKVHQGTYVVNEFNMPRENVKPLDNKLKIADGLLRHLLITKKEKTREEIEHEEKVQERILKRKEEELAQTEGEPKVEPVKEEKKTDKEEPKEDLVKEVEIKQKKKASKVSLEELDKKLDEILTDDILK